MRETLEQRAESSYSGRNQDPQLIKQMAGFAAAFARILLNEARPYMKHTGLCSLGMADKEPCSCGLAELMEGWK